MSAAMSVLFQELTAMGVVVRKGHLVRKPLLIQSQSLHGTRGKDGRSI